MTPSNDICPVCSYAGSAIYCECPSAEQRRTGVVPLDSLPAAWWNKMWADTTNRINEARDMVGQLITEVNNVLAAANINPQAACTDQLYQSINLIRQRLATATVAGSIVSSSDPNEVAVDANGKATVNCLGNATALTTNASTVVGAINELKSTYDCCLSDIDTCTGSLGTGKAPNMHASANTTYGVGNATCYGHVKLSDTYDSVLSECSGVAASQYALATAYACLIACAGAPLGNTAGCALGTAAAGSASTAARSDHVHPKPGCVSCSGQSYCVMDFNLNTQPIYIGYADTSLNCSQIGYLAAYSTTFCSGCKVIKDAPKDAVQCWLGLGGAAYCAASCFRSSSWTPTCVCCADYAWSACCADYATSAGSACCAGYAWAYYCRTGICVCLRCVSSGFGNCYYDVCACSKASGDALAIGVPGVCYGCCSGIISGHLIPFAFICIGQVVGQGLSSYSMPGIYLY